MSFFNAFPSGRDPGLVPDNAVITVVESHLVGPVIAGNLAIIGKLVVHPKPDE
jgi:hypothetical protein